MIEKLKEKLKEYSKAYYEGNPIVSDEMYDSLENFYQQLVGQFNPFDIREENYRTTVNHWYPLTSLSKSYNINNISNKLGSIDKLIREPKLDGLSLSVQYINGNLYKVITRGDGKKGNDVTFIMKEYFEKRNLSELSKKINLQVRGELIIPVEEEEYFKNLGFKSIRNVASGLVNKKEYDLNIEKCVFITHDVYLCDIDKKYTKIIERKKILKKLGFNVLPSFEWNGNNELLKTFEFKNKNYYIDGIVFKKENKTYSFDRQGYPDDAMAYKSEDRIQTLTSIKSIEWNMPNDRLIPKYVLEPVEMDGSIVQYATAHNYENIKNMIGLLKTGNIVSIIKAGDIIPQVKEIIEFGDGNDILHIDNIPDKCPYCKSELYNESVHLICKNPSCNAKKINRICKLIDVLEIKNIGYETVYSLTERYSLENFNDLINLSESDWENVSGLGKKARENFLKSYHEMIKNFGMEELLISLVIPLHGEKTIKSFRSVWKDDSFATLMSLKDKLVKIDNYSEYKFNILKEYLIKNSDNIKNLKKLIQKKFILKEENKIKGNIIVTGKYEKCSRKELEKLLDNMGYKMVSSVSDADILLCSDVTSSSSKMKKAKEKNIKIYMYEEFLGE